MPLVIQRSGGWEFPRVFFCFGEPAGARTGQRHFYNDDKVWRTEMRKGKRKAEGDGCVHTGVCML